MTCTKYVNLFLLGILIFSYKLIFIAGNASLDQYLKQKVGALFISSVG